ncbi:MAG: hypothetical protein H7123_06040 [Thermoleophilia bacterium]|nr:hypothetical protein [Thermoleophilia bacterium]
MDLLRHRLQYHLLLAVATVALPFVLAPSALAATASATIGNPGCGQAAAVVTMRNPTGHSVTFSISRNDVVEDTIVVGSHANSSARVVLAAHEQSLIFVSVDDAPADSLAATAAPACPAAGSVTTTTLAGKKTAVAGVSRAPKRPVVQQPLPYTGNSDLVPLGALGLLAMVAGAVLIRHRGSRTRQSAR